jgi:hypothetical protein
MLEANTMIGFYQYFIDQKKGLKKILNALIYKLGLHQ